MEKCQYIKNKSLKKASIILPVYNVEKYIDQCMESLLNQDYQNFEVIAVNDDSSDNSLNILKKWKKRDNRINIINLKKNGGLSNARNQGLERAKGDYLVFVDSDDWINKSYLSIMINILESTKADAVKCQLMNYNDGSFYSNNVLKAKRFETTGIGYMRLMLNYEQPGSTTRFIFKRDLWNGITFPKGRLYEDILTLPKVLRRVNKVTIINDILYYYRVGQSSISRTYTVKNRVKWAESLYETAQISQKLFPELASLCAHYCLCGYLEVLNSCNQYCIDTMEVLRFMKANLPKNVYQLKKMDKFFYLLLRYVSTNNHPYVFHKIMQFLNLKAKLQKN